MIVAKRILPGALVLLALCLAALPAGPGAAQDRSLDPERLPERVNLQTRIFRLQNTDPVSVAEILRQLYRRKDFAAIPDPRTRSVLIQSEPHLFEDLGEVLRELDVEPSAPGAGGLPGGELETRIFKLRHARLDDALEKVLKQVLKGSVALDSQRNVVIVQGTRGDLIIGEQVLSELDRAPEEGPSPGGKKVRVVWLIGGGTGLKNPSPIPVDLNQVVKELDKVGVTGLQMASQTLVETMTNQDFSVTFYPLLENPTEVVLSGRITERPERLPDLRITLQASQRTHADPSQPRPPGPFPAAVRSLCNLQTTVVTPPGHPVVLCVTPVEDMVSAFVIQVLAR